MTWSSCMAENPCRGTLHDILREEETTRMEVPTLSARRKGVAFRADRPLADESQIKLGNPVRNLEEFFLEVVKQAREQSVDTAGVQAGGEIPKYPDRL